MKDFFANDQLIKIRDWAQRKLNSEHTTPSTIRRCERMIALANKLLREQHFLPEPVRPANVIQLDRFRRRTGS